MFAQSLIRRRRAPTPMLSPQSPVDACTLT